MPTRALVLGGGGPVGIAWEAGVLLGLFEAGVDLAAAVDHVIGTSAGAYVGARIALGHAPSDIANPYAAREESGSGARNSSEASSLASLVQKIQHAARAGRSARETAREVGALALDAKTMREEEFVARFTSTLRSDGIGAWPSRSFACTAFDAEDGAFKIWDAAAGADLACAVASSCAVPGVFPPITIGKRRYFDGGVFSTTNADLAKGHDVVVVLAVMEVLMRYGFARDSKRTSLQREIAILREGGAEVQVIELDTDALQVVGTSFMDRSRQPAALQEGLRQGRAEAVTVRNAVSA